MVDKLSAFFEIDNICKIFLGFLAYSFIGWMIETLLHIFRDKKAVKRGFLFGPICPIYGVGAVALTIITGDKFDKFYELFAIGFLVCGLLEYSAHFILEKLFHAMWWDYSGRRFNLQGRVYLNGLIFMGIGSAVLLKFVNPFLIGLYEQVKPQIIHLICFIIYSVFVLDVATTIADLKNSVGVLRHIMNVALEEGQNIIDNTVEAVNDAQNSIKNNEKVLEIIKRLENEKHLSRFKKRFSGINIDKYKEILDIIRDKPDESKARRDIKVHGEENDFSNDVIIDKKSDN